MDRDHHYLFRFAEHVTTFASERSLRDSVDSSLVHTPAHSRAEIECRPRRHALYAEVRFATDDSAAHGCARLIPGPFPGRFRRWKAAGPTPPATTANTGSRSLELAHVGCAAGRRSGRSRGTIFWDDLGDRRTPPTTLRHSRLPPEDCSRGSVVVRIVATCASRRTRSRTLSEQIGLSHLARSLSV